MGNRRGRKTTRSGTRAPSQQAAFQQAQAAHRAGKLAAAQAGYESILRSEPGHADALHMLGVIAHQQQRHERAQALIQRALEHDPGTEGAHYNLGCILLERGEHRAAMRHLQRALLAQPGFAQAHRKLGDALRHAGQARAACDEYRRAVELDPQLPEAHYNLGTLLQSLESHAEAVEHLRRALQLAPQLAVAHGNLGLALRSLGQLEPARRHLRRAVELEPASVTARNTLCEFHERLNELPQAWDCNREALQLEPDNADALFLRGLLLRRRGETGEALAALQPLRGSELHPEYACRLQFELGKLHDSLGSPQRAFRCFSEGNRLQAGSAAAQRCRAETYLEQVQQMAGLVAGQPPATWRLRHQPGGRRAPVFVVGFPRSGTTLIQRILQSHPQLQVLEEKPALAAVERMLETSAGGFPAALCSLAPERVQALRDRYFEAAQQWLPPGYGGLVVDKLPLNIVNLPLIQRVFPDAQIVIALRHPCDVVLSNFMQRYRLNHAMANFGDLAGSARLYRRVMSLWLRCNTLLPLHAHHLRYEALVSDPEEEVRALLQFIGVDWHAPVLAFHRQQAGHGAVDTPSYEQVSRPIYRHASGRWQRYREQLQPHLPELAPVAEALGYELGFDAPAPVWQAPAPGGAAPMLAAE